MHIGLGTVRDFQRWRLPEFRSVYGDDYAKALLALLPEEWEEVKSGRARLRIHESTAILDYT